MRNPDDHIVELLSPAGDRERLEAAVRYGADAVYLGSTRLGMRAAPDNFDPVQLKEACEFCHSNGVKVYLTVNIIPRNSDLDHVPQLLKDAEAAGVDALIISDLGIMALAKELVPGIELHVSTQTGVANYAAANVLYEWGAKRVVLARELSLEEVRTICANTPADLEIECFVHGAMCVSFSGRCLLSNYLTGRDSNRGDCAQPCRWKYALVEEKRPGRYFSIGEDDGTYIMNSKDMCMIEHIPELIDAGVTSFKIEGRAKSAYYVAVTTNAYRAAIDGFLKAPHASYRPEQWMIDETRKVSHRDYCTGFFFGDPKDDAQIYYEGGYKRDWFVVGEVLGTKDGRVYATQRNRFFDGDEVEIMTAGQKPVRLVVTDLRNDDFEPIASAPHPMMPFSFACDLDFPAGSLIRSDSDRR